MVTHETTGTQTLAHNTSRLHSLGGATLTAERAAPPRAENKMLLFHMTAVSVLTATTPPSSENNKQCSHVGGVLGLTPSVST